MTETDFKPCWRQTTDRETGQKLWAIMGPSSIIQPGEIVTVHRQDGKTSEEYIESTGKPFDRNGVEFVYGYQCQKDPKDRL